MASVKGRGVVIAENAFGDSDRRVTALIKDYGKLTASAKGARKAGSKFLAGTQLFTYADFVFYDGGTFYSISSVDIIQNFHDLRNDYDCFCMASYFAEIAGAFTVSDEPANDILALTLIAFARLSKLGAPSVQERAVFELKLLQFAGLSPEWPVSQEAFAPRSVRDAILRALSGSSKDAFDLNMSRETAGGIMRFTERLIKRNVPYIKSLKFL
ncbi:MAG: DNA repair protein RecO [Clostridiales bacterium]|jgi:DNA repair protein RecO (recombination protein O)|nr:DNA repair protein RecO [Clostridiales bacterium]